MRAALWIGLSVVLSGCLRVPGGGASTPPTSRPAARRICFTRAEAERIRLGQAAARRRLVNCKAARLKDQAAAARDKAKAASRLKRCRTEKAALVSRPCPPPRCPSCSTPWVLVGVLGSVVVGVGVVAVYFALR